MPSKYISTREKVMDYIENNILLFLKQKDLDYYEVIKIIKIKTSCSENLIKNILKDYINSGKIKEIRVLTIPDEQIGEWLKNLKEMEEQKEKDDEEVKKMLEFKPKEKQDATKK